MNTLLSTRLSPLAAWLILASAIATLFPLKLEQIQLLLLTVTVLSMLWLPGKRLRSAPFLLLYVISATLALTVPLPLPQYMNPLATLILALIIWGLVLTIPLSAVLYHLLRTARPESHPPHNSKTDKPHRQAR